MNNRKTIGGLKMNLAEKKAEIEAEIKATKAEIEAEITAATGITAKTKAIKQAIVITVLATTLSIACNELVNALVIEKNCSISSKYKEEITEMVKRLKTIDEDLVNETMIFLEKGGIS